MSLALHLRLARADRKINLEGSQLRAVGKEDAPFNGQKLKAIATAWRKVNVDLPRFDSKGDSLLRLFLPQVVAHVACILLNNYTLLPPTPGTGLERFKGYVSFRPHV